MLRSEMEGFVETRGAKPLTDDQDKLAEYLIGIEDGSTILTTYMRTTMSAKGYLEVVLHEPNGQRGRPGSHVELTKKAKQVINLYKARRARKLKRQKLLAEKSKSNLKAA